MNTVERYDLLEQDRIRLMKRKELKKIRERNLFIMKSLILSIVIIIFISIYGILTVHADDSLDNNSNPVKYYTSITVEKNDSLWSIADKYKPDNYNYKEYIMELKQMNNMCDDKIYSGENLIIFYYE